MTETRREPKGRAMFEGFERRRIEVDGIAINLVHGGEGLPVLLLHGYPQSHVEWHKLAPILAERFTVVAPDLRGYGDSDKPMPATADDLSLYCKRAMAADQVQVMAVLGHRAFHVVGHDRGARVGHRMALDHADEVLSFTSLDVVASEAAFAAMDSDMAFSWFHWNLMRQPAPLPETMIANSVELYLNFLLDTWCAVEGAITEAARAEYLRCFSDPDCIRATCLDYRGIALDLAHDAADRGTKIRAPMLVLWASEMAKRPGWQTGRSLDILESWRQRAESVSGRALACGHFLPEELPEQTAAEIVAFINGIEKE